MKKQDEQKLQAEQEQADAVEVAKAAEEEKNKEQEETMEQQPTEEELEKKAEEKTIDWIDKKLNAAVKRAEDVAKEALGEAPEEGEELEEGDEIPDEFTEAALAAGWSEEDIINFASDYTDEELISMLPFLKAEPLPEEEATEDVGEKTTTEELDEFTDLDDVSKLKNRLKQEVLQEVSKELGDLKKRLSAAEKKERMERELEMLKLANDFFDKVSEEIPVFGKTEKLPKFPAGRQKGLLIPTDPAVRAREQVYQRALLFHSLGGSWKDALEDALAWYKGKHLEKDFKRKVLAELKQGEQRLSAKRIRKDTSHEFADEEERKAAIVRELARKAGADLG